MDQKKIGSFLKELRKEKGLTQEQLAEKMKMMKKLHIFSWIGVVSFLIYLALDVTGLAGQGITEAIASFCSGLSLGMLITAVLYTSNSIYKIKAFKKRLLGKK